MEYSAWEGKAVSFKAKTEKAVNGNERKAVGVEREKDNAVNGRRKEGAKLIEYSALKGKERQ